MHSGIYKDGNTIQEIIESVYTGGISKILKFELTPKNGITGFFHDWDDLYKFDISPQGTLSYIEAKPQELRGDSYLIGFYTDSGLTKNHSGVRVRNDRRKKCVRGKPCKGTCIAKNSHCRSQLSPKVKNQFLSLRQTLITTKESNLKSSEETLITGNNNNWKIAATVGAVAIGVPISSYLAVRTKYRTGFEESASLAKQQANARLAKQNIKSSSTLKTGFGEGREEAKQMTFVTGGFAGDGGMNSLKWARELKDEGNEFKDHHIVVVNNKDFDFDLEEEAHRMESDQFSVARFTTNPLALSMEMSSRLMLKTVFKKGRNPVAVKMAEDVYTYHKKYPDKPINLVGYSGGGMVTHEAAEILKKMKVNVKVANFGSPYWGLTEKIGSSITFGSENDVVLNNKVLRDRINVNSVVSHHEYLKNKEVRTYLKDFFDDKKITSSGRKMTEQEKAKIERRKKAVERLEKKKAKKNKVAVSV